MKKLKFLLVVSLVGLMSAGCTSAYFSASSGSAYDDLYVSHNRTAIAERQKAEAEARRAEAEARRAEAEALQAEYEAQLAQLNVKAVKSGVAPQQETSDGLIIITDNNTSNNGYQGFVANSYESAYARRLQGFKSMSYRMPSSYFNLRYSGSYAYATAYDPAIYNIMVSGDQVWVEPRYITSMFGTWGATNATALLYSPWYYGWNSWHRYDPWYYSWYGYPRYSWYDWNWNICYGGGWSVNLWWGWGGHYHPWRPSYHHHHYHPHHIGHGPVFGHGHYGGVHAGGWWGGGSYYGSRNTAPRVVGNTPTNSQGTPQGKPARAGSIVNRGSVTSTPYRSPSTGSTYGQSSRGGSNASAAQNGSVNRGNATSGRGSVTGTTSSSSSSNKSSVSRVTTSRSGSSATSSRNTTATRSSSTSSSSSSSRSSYSSGSSYSGSSSSRSGGSFSGSSFSGGASRGGGSVGGSTGGSRGGR